MDQFRLMDQFCEERVPFLFIIDYEMCNPQIYLLTEINENQRVKAKFPNYSNISEEDNSEEKIHFDKKPIPFLEYQKAFNFVQDELHFGNTYLTNLTFETPVDTSADLEKIFSVAHAKYKLLLPHLFVCFSPETFITIKDEEITTRPMKGTINADEKNAKQKLLDNEKENAEHATIVDLMRNDLSMVAKDVRVENYRYLEKIQTQAGALLQSSSKISGKLLPQYQKRYGSLLQKILPAGSISGAPKKSTLKIIKEAENYNRGYYTGVMGVFDGEDLDSAVMIRFLELKNNKYFYKSGGGITALSRAEEEYQEMINKIYVPIL